MRSKKNCECLMKSRQNGTLDSEIKNRLNGGLILARLERFELPTDWFEASYSIQLSYRRNSNNPF